MPRILIALLFAFVVSAIGAAPASAHETRTYRIGTDTYAVTVGSLGEPLVVDDKSGTDVTILRNGQPLTGAEALLQVEVMSGGVSRVFPLETVFGQEGKYKTVFFPTTADPLSYRLFGTLGGQPFDVTYACAAGGHQMHGEEDRTEVAVSEGVTQIAHRGAFTCPATKSEFEFPAATRDQKALDEGLGLIAGVGVIALLVSLLALAVALAQTGHMPRLKRSVDSLFEAPLVSAIAIVVIILFLASFVSATLTGRSHHGGGHGGHDMPGGAAGPATGPAMDHSQHAAPAPVR